MSKCEICGEPMPEGEEMFKFHGYSGDCPKPPLLKKIGVVVEYYHAEDRDGSFWLIANVDRKPYTQIGPFKTETERNAAHDDLMAMLSSTGATTLPSGKQP